LARSPLSLTTKFFFFFFQLNPLGHGPYVTSSLTTGRLCHMYVSHI
jgi:hypothetical protein